MLLFRLCFDTFMLCRNLVPIHLILFYVHKFSNPQKKAHHLESLFIKLGALFSLKWDMWIPLAVLSLREIAFQLYKTNHAPFGWRPDSRG